MSVRPPAPFLLLGGYAGMVSLLPEEQIGLEGKVPAKLPASTVPATQHKHQPAEHTMPRQLHVRPEKKNGKRVAICRDLPPYNQERLLAVNRLVRNSHLCSQFTLRPPLRRRPQLSSSTPPHAPLQNLHGPVHALPLQGLCRAGHRRCAQARLHGTRVHTKVRGWVLLGDLQRRLAQRRLGISVGTFI